MLLVSALLCGCAHSGPPSPDPAYDTARYMSLQIEQTKKEKTVVVCLQSDAATNRRLETYMVQYLKKDGFQAVGTQDVFTVRPSYAPRGLLSELRSAKVAGIIEVKFWGNITREGVPEHFTLEHRRLKVKKRDVNQRSCATLAEALMHLMIAMPVAKL